MKTKLALSAHVKLIRLSTMRLCAFSIILCICKWYPLMNIKIVTEEGLVEWKHSRRVDDLNGMVL